MKQESQGSFIDWRIISLLPQQGVRDIDEEQINSDIYCGKMFSHYERIYVTGKTIAASENDRLDEDPLYQAYEEVKQRKQDNGFGQTILAFTNCSDYSLSDQGLITQKKIETFWQDKTEPLLFVTMLNLNPQKETATKDVLDSIYSIFRGKYLTYFTFDFCDLILFFKGHSFAEYASNLFELDYKGESLPSIVDSITVYSFAGDNLTQNQFVKESKERFGVYLKYGVNNMQQALAYADKLGSIQPCQKVQKNWIIGRHDVGFLVQGVSLQWLSRVFTSLSSCEKNDTWYNLFTLSVLVPVDEEKKQEMRQLAPRYVSFPGDEGLLFEEKYTKFKELYENTCKRINIHTDISWLRWLHETTQLISSFVANNMTVDMGVCLAAQLLNFYQYSFFVWSQSDEIIAQIQNEWERCSNSLFTNISILLDSMNHHQRQFILAPSFCTPAFEMPPKIMAYYSIVLHQLISAFEDPIADENWCLFTLCPNFASTLQVRSLIPEMALLLGRDRYQYISVGIVEEEMYRLRSTTVVLAHEISHFVGKETRCRSSRKKYVLLLEIVSMVEDLYLSFLDHLYVFCSLPKPADKDISPAVFRRKPFYEIANNILSILKEAEPKVFDESSYYYRDEIVDLLRTLFQRFQENGKIQLMLLSFYQELIKGEQELYPKLLETLQELTGNVFVKQSDIVWHSTSYLQRFFDETLACLAQKEQSRVSTEFAKRRDQICENFSEAYADLNAILLFQLSYKQFLELFHGNKMKQKYNRFLSIADSLVKIGAWTQSDLQIEDENLELEFVLVRLKQAWDYEGNPQMAQKQDYDLRMLDNIDTAGVFYLSKYLQECGKQIKEKFSNNQRVSDIRSLFESIDKSKDFSHIISAISKMVNCYRNSILPTLTTDRK